ncbi:malonate decarboxylase subunit epsilon [Bordetella genomosp. 9]|uniref:Malonyl CoA-acyl carrier protein transacylase n=1 Tax=Bordetella genomosp. 9 TaxID=1416803 RepID=A0A261R1G1_9BORD|nr:malonate decarboxylase subunit epsilon [Bordetella genomosp. 9]OZI18885.1 malonate decarboxylase subunit epsilon [Bordetella genomosp. 9]
MSVLFTFPGQGSQRPGMLSRLPATAEVAQTLRIAEDVLKLDPLALETEEALRSTVAVQLALTIAGVAMGRTLAEREGLPDMVAGMSIGAYPAAVVAGALSYEDALRLVALRARLMEEAYPRGYGMTAIQGLDADQVQALVEQVRGGGQPVYLANINAERQIVISGSNDAMTHAAALATAAGSTGCTRLAVSVPSHCELLNGAADTLRRAFSTVVLQRPRIVYLSGTHSRRLHDPAAISDDLANNLARRVNWYDTVRSAWERGARLAVEMPSGEVLTRLTGATFADGLAVAADSTSVDSLCLLINREQRR